MSRQSILLPSTISAPAAAHGETSTSALVVCGFDRLPYKHLFCTVFDPSRPDSEEEPVWLSILDEAYSRVTTPDGFDTKLAELGITLPPQFKAALQEDWMNADMSRVKHWLSHSSIGAEGV